MLFRNSFIIAASAWLTAVSANNSSLTTSTPSVSSACSFSDFTATNSAELATVTACSVVVGDITVQGDQFGAVDITGVQKIYGDFIVNNATLATAVSAPDLELISGSFTLERLTILSNLNLAQLTTVGSLNFNALPALQSAGLTSGITSADNIVISDTGLTSLTGIDVSQVETFNINNNKDIDTIDTALKIVTSLLQISANADQVDVTLDDLSSANEVVFQSIASLSISNLTSVNDSISFLENTFSSLNVSSLTTVGKSLSINQNDDLTEVDFSGLKSIGGAFSVANNTDLITLDGFDVLKTIGGAVTLQGDFDNATFPALNSVAGGFILESTGNATCDAFNKLNKAGDIAGDKYVCSGASTSTSSSSSKSGSSTATSGSASSGSASTSSSTSSSSSSSSAKSSSGSKTDFKLVGLFATFFMIGLTLL